MSGRRDGPSMRSGCSSHSFGKSRIAAPVGRCRRHCYQLCLHHLAPRWALLHLDGLFSIAGPPLRNGRLVKSQGESSSSSCDSSERMNLLKLKNVAVSQKNAELKKEVRELMEKLKLAEQGKDQAQKQVLAWVNSRKPGHLVLLAKILEKVAVNRELVVALANSNVKELLEVWFTNIKRVGILNYLVVPLDEDIGKFYPDEDVDSIGRTGGSPAVSGLKFRILREFLQLGYSVLLSDVDIVYLQNPFDHLYRDSDEESMSDGHDNRTAYGFDDVFDEPGMDWTRDGFFYIRPTIPSIELLDRVAARLSQENAWDQAVFNEELFFPSHNGYDGLHAAKRTMDFYLFMKPVIVHVNYHHDKLLRMKAVVEYYVNGKEDALKPFPNRADS
ncbi:hypothetical protein ACJRO7_034824 [Eucalyptus globulus]|uniref:Nucleotide-diphospho-sugar transferase domain-containing protein n=1 Tax=Eucalyptus globulus TaxID=34317 RepID=A0ABD3JAD1_EUCGL